MEKDMFPIIKSYLIEHGYDVKAEVMHADIVAMKDDDVLIVEMKTSLSTKLMYQGLKRMHLSHDVYLAVPKPSHKVLRSSNFHEKKTIIRRLALGLMLVDMHKESVDVLFDPNPYVLKKQSRKKKRLLSEFNQRTTSLNVGGVTKTKIMTAYKELALKGLYLLKDGPQTTKYLRETLNNKKIVNILQMNYYKWFERVNRGIYQLTDEGKKALIIYEEVLHKLNIA